MTDKTDTAPVEDVAPDPAEHRVEDVPPPPPAAPTSPPANRPAGWFLELVGLDLDDTPRTLEQVAREEEVATTGELVGKLWESGRRSNVLDDWAPNELSPTITTERNFRWPVIAATVFIGVLVAIALLVIPGLADRAAEARADEYRAALIDLQNALPGGQEALRIATEPDATVDELAATSDALTLLTNAAATVTRSGNQPLPSPVPLMPSDAIDALAPARSAMGDIGARGDAIASRIATVIDYREQLADILALPELPIEAGTNRINSLSVRLAELTADAIVILDALPGDAALAEHHAELARFVDFLGSWQVEYLDALRRDDGAAAQRLSSDLGDRRLALASLLPPALSKIRSEVDAAIIELSEDIRLTLVELPG